MCFVMRRARFYVTPICPQLVVHVEWFEAGLLNEVSTCLPPPRDSPREEGRLFFHVALVILLVNLLFLQYFSYSTVVLIHRGLTPPHPKKYTSVGSLLPFYSHGSLTLNPVLSSSIM